MILIFIVLTPRRLPFDLIITKLIRVIVTLLTNFDFFSFFPFFNVKFFSQDDPPATCVFNRIYREPNVTSTVSLRLTSARFIPQFQLVLEIYSRSSRSCRLIVPFSPQLAPPPLIHYHHECHYTIGDASLLEKCLRQGKRIRIRQTSRSRESCLTMTEKSVLHHQKRTIFC